MIGIGIFGSTFGGLLKYMSREDRKRLMEYLTSDRHTIGAIRYCNLAARTPQEAAREMTFTARRAPKCTKPVFQLILALHPSQKIHPERLLLVTSRVLERLGLADHQAVIVVHTEKDHLHSHAAVNRVNADGKPWPMWRSANRIRAVCREVEREMGLVPYVGNESRSRGIEPQNWTAKELRAYEQSGVKPLRIRRELFKAESRSYARSIAPQLRPAFEIAHSWQELHRELATRGFYLSVFERKGALPGLQVCGEDNKRTAASNLDSKFSFPSLKKRFGPFVADHSIQHEVGARIIRARRSTSPDELNAAEGRLLESYRRETEPARQALEAALKESRLKEKLEREAERQKLDALLPKIQANGSRKPKVVILRQYIREEHGEKLRAIREKYGKERRSIRDRIKIDTWIQFLIRRAQQLVQDAVALLHWFRGHLTGKSQNRLVSPNAQRPTPPEAVRPLHLLSLEERRSFEGEHSWRQGMIDVVSAAGLLPSVTANGIVEYRNRAKNLVFTDRGRDIVIAQADTEYIDSESMRLALTYSQYKWGTSSARGDLYFTEVAIGVASKERIKLEERFSERDFMWEIKGRKNQHSRGR